MYINVWVMVFIFLTQHYYVQSQLNTVTHTLMESCCVEEFLPSAVAEDNWGFTSAMDMVGGVSPAIFSLCEEIHGTLFRSRMLPRQAGIPPSINGSSSARRYLAQRFTRQNKQRFSSYKIKLKKIIKKSFTPLQPMTPWEWRWGVPQNRWWHNVRF